ncbi:hypothetical protein BJV82DRAFT_667448 [Fennellomyces sp. T-0311]|nr:hypothetical protein BJV82DRAFT_667448 [Fennellomyces sp. T-0311]
MTDQEATSPTVHLLPFTSSHEGPVNSQQYFQFAPTTSLEHKHATIETYETMVMGRRLIGYNIELPKTCTGNIWQYVEAREEEEEQSPKLVKRSRPAVSRFVLWKKDTAPSDQDPRLKVIKDWHNVTDAIHEPIPL